MTNSEFHILLDAIVGLEQKFDQKLDQRFAEFEERFERKLTTKFEAMLDKRFVQFEQKMDDKLEEKLTPIRLAIYETNAALDDFRIHAFKEMDNSRKENNHRFSVVELAIVHLERKIEDAN